MEKVNEQEEVAALANEITLQYYRWNQVGLHKLYHNMSSMDYAAMWIISRHIEGAEENKKIYLKDISAQLNLPMSRVSKMVQRLQEKGLVYWKHDGKGEDGTYIQITEHGIQQAMEQQEILQNFYHKVIQQFGKERFIQLLEEMKELEGIMNQEIENRDKEA